MMATFRIFGYMMLALLLLQLIALTSAAYEVTFFKPVTSYWANCYDPTCTTWQQCPTETPARTCITFTSTEGFTVLGTNGSVIGVKSDASIKTFKIVTDFKQQTSYLFNSAQYDGTYTPCSATSSITSGAGYTSMDCCMATYPTCPVLAGQTSVDLPYPSSCVYCYLGFGSCYGTPCESFYASQSKYGTISKPTGGVFTDYGVARKSFEFNCYIENWSNYRPKPNYNFDYATSLPSCDSIFYAFQTFTDRSGGLSYGLREDHDGANLQAYSGKYKTYLTIGGWTMAGEMWDAVVADPKSISEIIKIVQQYNLYGVDIDCEWPGQRGMDPAKVPAFQAWVKKLAAELVKIGKFTDYGMLSVGNPYNPSLYTDIGPSIDRFNLFGYDLHGGWDAFKASQSQVEPYDFPSDGSFSLQVMLDNMANLNLLSKTSLGLALYARGWTVASASFDARIIGPGPSTDPMLGPGESGSSMLELSKHSSVVKYIPTACNVAGVQVRKVASDRCAYECVAETTTGVFTHMIFTGKESIECIVDWAIDKYSLTSYYVYACSMNPAACTDVGTMIKGKANAPRMKRSLSTTYYAFPSDKISVPTTCAGILVWDTTGGIVVTDKTYYGCQSTTTNGLYCYYKLADFTCQQGTRTTLKTESGTQCNGISVNTLLPVSKGARVCVVSGGLVYVSTQVTICTDDMGPVADPLKSYNLVYSINSTIGTLTKPVYSDWEFKYANLFIPTPCTNFTGTIGCVEAVCGPSQACIDKVVTLGFSPACESFSGLQAEYMATLAAIKESSAHSMYLRGALLDALSMNVPHGGTARVARFIEGYIALGISIANSVAIIGMGIDYGNFKATTNGRLDNQDAQIAKTAAKVNEIVANVNDLRGDLASALREQDVFNKDVKSAIDTLDKNQVLLQNKLNTFGTTVASAINSIMRDISQLQADFATGTALTAGIFAYGNEVNQVNFLATNYLIALQRLNTRLAGCLDGLNSGNYRPCLDSTGIVKPLTYDVVSVSGGTYIVFGYLEKTALSYVSYAATAAYCYKDELYVAASECEFIVNGTVMIHLQKDFGPCPKPALVSAFKCSKKIYPIVYDVPKKPTFVFTYLNTTVAEPKNITEFNYTELALEVINHINIPNLTVIADKISNETLKPIDVGYNPLKVITDNTTTILIVVMAVVSVLAVMTIASFLIKLKHD